MTGTKGRIKTVSHVLRSLMEIQKKAGLRDKDVGYRMDTNPSQISNWRRGEYAPNILAIEELAVALDCEIIVRRKR